MKYKSGQILLVTIMLVATILTVALSVTFTSKTETQITKLEEDSQKALAAAEAGIEAILKGNNTSILNLNNLGLGNEISGIAEVTSSIGNTFVSPLIKKDEEYTFYLSDFNLDESGLRTFSNPSSGNLTFFFGTGSGYDCSSRTTPALELTFISSIASNPVVTRKIIDPCSSGITIGTTDNAPTTNEETVDGITFTYRTSSPVTIPTDSYVVIMRSLFSPTRIGVQSTNQLKNQGKVITSTASVETSTTKKIQLFQSYPQIPTEFFVTRF